MKLLAAILICSQLIGCAGSFPLEHTAIALGTTAAGETMGNCWAGAAVGSALLVSREYTQAEYRWIAAAGDSASEGRVTLVLTPDGKGAWQIRHAPHCDSCIAVIPAPAQPFDNHPAARACWLGYCE